MIKLNNIDKFAGDRFETEILQAPSHSSKGSSINEEVVLHAKRKRKIMSNDSVLLHTQELTLRKKKLKREIKTLRQKVIRRDKKIKTLTDLLNSLRFDISTILSDSSDE